MQANISMSTGLYNSASFMSAMLNSMNIHSEMVVVTDANDIDREVTKTKPTHVFIEALWVMPAKFHVLQQLHPTVTWIVRLHSDMPFIAGEGMAMDWISDYSSYANVVIAANAPRIQRELQIILKLRNAWTDRKAASKVIYLPNYYPQSYNTKVLDHKKPTVDICCFGAVRPLKNHLLQATAALEFAVKHKKKLRFHINAGRMEGKGEPVMRNLENLFAQIHRSGHQLVSHAWTPRAQFLELCATMDLGMQVSLSETFNIVGADLISQGVPLVSSAEIPWAAGLFSADPTSSVSIAHRLHMAWELSSINVWWQQHNLKSYTDKTKRIWRSYIQGK
jgi:hypothetical protein